MITTYPDGKIILNEENIYQMIRDEIEAALEYENGRIKQLQDLLSEELKDYSQRNKSAHQQMDMIDTMIKQHAIGVQNVYSRFTEFKDNKDEELEKLKEDVRLLKNSKGSHDP